MEHYTSPLVASAGQPVIVYIDIKSPYAFVALKPTFALERELGMQFDWRPLTLDIPSYLGSARKKAGKVVESTRSPSQWSGVKYGYRDARRYVERQGYILKGTEKIWDSSIVNIGILWVTEHARDKLEEYLEVVYPKFWRRELDVEDVFVVANCLEEAGVSSTGFAEFQQGIGRAVHDQLQSQLHSNGIYGVPTYVFDQHILFGREHLPLLRWYLSGKPGEAPDMAYEISQLIEGVK
jgi:2-hydroxychromene-2-carboxylate isomerase